MPPTLAAVLYGTLLLSGVVWEEGRNFRRAKLALAGTGKDGFTLLPPAATGVHFSNVLSLDRAYTNSILANGSGVALGDVDGDGRCDLYLAGLDGPNALYRNLGGWKFEEITRAAGVACENLFCTGAALVDVDGDSDLDLLVNAMFGGTRLFLNDGQAHFTDATRRFGLASESGATSLALGDIDGDSDLDLYVANYRNSTVRDEPGTRLRVLRQNTNRTWIEVNGVPATNETMAARFSFDPVEGVVENGEPDVLYLNQGDSFRAVAWTHGAFLDEFSRPIPTPCDWGLSVMIRDLNGDGAPDIYVCNDFLSPDRIWINQGNGRFKALSTAALRDTSRFSMGVDAADINRDGHIDLFVLDMLDRTRRRRWNQVTPPKRVAESLDPRARVQHSRNTLLLNRGDGTYAEIAFLAGLHASDWSWAPVFLDVDMDGYEDLLVSNGFIYDGQNIDAGNEALATVRRQPLSRLDHLRLRGLLPKLDTPNRAFRNRADLTFEDASEKWHFNAAGISQGMALADLDDDGDLDLVVNNLNAPASLYRNDSSAPRVAVRLKGAARNSRGIGARITVAGGPVAQSQEMVSGGRYLSCDDALRVFAAGPTTNALRITVRWRNGTETTVENASSGWLYEIYEDHTASTAKTNPPAERATLFADASASLGHACQAGATLDFEIQPLLPRKVSQSGPAVAVLGNSVIAVGGTRGGKIAFFNPRPTGVFSKIEVPDGGLQADAQGMVVLPGQRDSRLIVALSTPERQPAGSLIEISARANALTVSTNFPRFESAIGPLAAADLDGDGALELFVGGRPRPANYPGACSSFILRQSADEWRIDENLSRPLENLGVVNGAIFSDLDGNGRPDLALARDWGAVGIFINENGRLTDRTAAFGLADFRGWWNGIAAGDFDGDGRMDLVASNWGRNNKYQECLRDELRIYRGAWLAAGRWSLLEAYFDPDEKKVVPWPAYSRCLEALPFLRSRFPTAASYAAAGLDEILSGHWTATREWRVNTLDSMVFLNRGARFKARSLPVEAQFAPAFGIAVADFNGDAADDVFLAQNFFETDADTERYSSGRGLLLLGDGRGDFKPVPGQESGLVVLGEQRGAASGDFNADGRADLLVAQSNGALRLFMNMNPSPPALRARLIGRDVNPGAIGAAMRALYEPGGGQSPRLGPLREPRAGSGSGSQDGLTQLFGDRERIVALAVRWPDGHTNLVHVPPGAKEILLDHDGAVSVR